MSFFGNAFDFDKFALKDMWNKIRDDPERLFIGAIDPWSTKMWNGILDKDYEPLIDQMGGPYGGHTFSMFGDKDGGVYARAREAGIDTKAGGQMHDAAHVIAGLFAGGYGLAALGGGGAAAGGAAGGAGGAAGGMGALAGGLPAGIEGVTVTASGSSALPAIGGAAAGGAAAGSTGGDGYNWKQWLRSPQQQGSQGSKQNAYESFLANQERAQKVAQALTDRHDDQSAEYAQQVEMQRRRRAIAQAMMQQYG